MRRSILRSTGTALALGSLALTGCGQARDTGTVDLTADDLLVTTPPGGEIDRVVWNSPFGELASLDPIKAFNYPENSVVANLCESLFQLQPDFSVEPNLASEVQTEDSRTFVFTVRDDVTFWNGDQMTAEDVAFSLDRHLDPDEGSYVAADFSRVESVETTDDWEVTVTLSEPDTIFVETLATNTGAVVQQEHREETGPDYGNPDAGVMCTGPLQVGQWHQGQSITLERHDDYWNAERAATADEVDIRFVVDPTAITSALTTGEIQGSYDVPLSAVTDLAETTTGDLLHGHSMQFMAVISTGDGIFGDPAVRRALTLATDRDAIAETIFEGTATPSRSLVPQTSWDVAAEITEDFALLREDSLAGLDHDLAAAEAALEQAEADLSEPIRIVYPSERSFYADILNEMSNGAEQIGLSLEPVGVPSAQFGSFFSDPAAREGYDGFVTLNYMSSPSPLRHLENIAGTDGYQNYSGFSDAEIDEALAAALAEEDDAARLELTVEAEALIMEQQPWVPVVDLSTRLYLDESVTGAPASFVYLYYPWAADVGSAE